VDKDQTLASRRGTMERGSRLAVGTVLVCIVCVVAIGFVMTRYSVLGFCEAATFCRSGAFCVCPEYYAPVLGLPSFKVYSNACFACVEGAWLWMAI
jgi:hypothetical protein